MKVSLVSLLFCSSATHAFSYSGGSWQSGQAMIIPNQKPEPVRVVPIPEPAKLEISASMVQSKQYARNNPHIYGTKRWHDWNDNNGISDDDPYYIQSNGSSQYPTLDISASQSYTYNTQPIYSQNQDYYQPTVSPSYTQPTYDYSYNNNNYVQPSYQQNYDYSNNNVQPSYQQSYDYNNNYVQPSYSQNYYDATITPSFSQPSYNSYSQGTVGNNPHKYGTTRWQEWNRQNGISGTSTIFMKAQHSDEMEEEGTEIEVKEEKVSVQEEGEDKEENTQESPSGFPVAIIVVSVLVIGVLSALTIRFLYKSMNLKQNNKSSNIQIDMNRQSELKHIELNDDESGSQAKFDNESIENQNQEYVK